MKGEGKNQCVCIGILLKKTQHFKKFTGTWIWLVTLSYSVKPADVLSYKTLLNLYLIYSKMCTILHSINSFQNLGIFIQKCCYWRYFSFVKSNNNMCIFMFQMLVRMLLHSVLFERFKGCDPQLSELQTNPRKIQQNEIVILSWNSVCICK